MITVYYVCINIIYFKYYTNKLIYFSIKRRDTKKKKKVTARLCIIKSFNLNSKCYKLITYVNM